MTNGELEHLILKFPGVGDEVPSKHRPIPLAFGLGLVTLFWWFLIRLIQDFL